MGFESSYRSPSELEKLGLKNVFGARFEKGSAQIHPLKLRNALLKLCLQRGLAYHTGIQVEKVEASGLSSVQIEAKNGLVLNYDAIVVATNAYSPLISRFFSERKLVEPFRGKSSVVSPFGRTSR